MFFLLTSRWGSTGRDTRTHCPPPDRIALHECVQQHDRTCRLTRTVITATIDRRATVVGKIISLEGGR